MSSLKSPTAVETEARMNRAGDTPHPQTLLFVHRRGVVGELGPEGLFSAVRSVVPSNPNPECDANHPATDASRCWGYQQSSSGMAMMSPRATRRPALRARESPRSD